GHSLAPDVVEAVAQPELTQQEPLGARASEREPRHAIGRDLDEDGDRAFTAVPGREQIRGPEGRFPHDVYGEPLATEKLREKARQIASLRRRSDEHHDRPGARRGLRGISPGRGHRDRRSNRRQSRRHGYRHAEAGTSHRELAESPAGTSPGGFGGPSPKSSSAAIRRRAAPA